MLSLREIQDNCNFKMHDSWCWWWWFLPGCQPTIRQGDEFGVAYDYRDNMALSTCTALLQPDGRVYAVRRRRNCAKISASCRKYVPHNYLALISWLVTIFHCANRYSKQPESCCSIISGVKTFVPISNMCKRWKVVGAKMFLFTGNPMLQFDTFLTHFSYKQLLSIP